MQIELIIFLATLAAGALKKISWKVVFLIWAGLVVVYAIGVYNGVKKTVQIGKGIAGGIAGALSNPFTTAADALMGLFGI